MFSNHHCIFPTMLALLSLRNALLFVVASTFVIFVSFQISWSADRFLYSPPESIKTRHGRSAPQFIDPADNKFHWSRISQRYPVRDFIPMPSNATQIPQIQHLFPAENRRSRKIRLSRLDQIKAEFMHAWSGYKTNAWLSDELGPVSGGTVESFGGWPVTMVDSLGKLTVASTSPLMLIFSARHSMDHGPERRV